MPRTRRRGTGGRFDKGGGRSDGRFSLHPENPILESRMHANVPVRFGRGLATRSRSTLSEHDSLSCSWLVSSQVPDPCKRQVTKRAKAEGVKPKGCLNHPGAPGEGKIGRVNESELLMRLRQRRSPETVVSPFTAIGGQHPGEELLPCCKIPPRSCAWTPVTPEYRKHPPRSFLTGAKRGNPVVVCTLSSRPDDLRKNGLTPQRGHEDPGSECRQPKGEGKS
jgi:hypothetical protein